MTARRAPRLLLLAALLAGGCATVPGAPDTRIEHLASARVADVPHFPQTDLQCGPAALASLLHTAQRPADVAVLGQWMFTPGLGGTLQQDVLGAARRAGTLPVRIDGTLTALQAQLALGRPVLVLLNLALPRWPHWHYAAVTGIDVPNARILVSAAPGERAHFTVRDFARAWGYAEHWAIVTLRPDEAPTGLGVDALVEAVTSFEATAPAVLAQQAYTAALAAWPDVPALRFGAGNVALALGHLDAAAAHYEALLHREQLHEDGPRANDAAVLNNLAEVRRRQGRLREAAALARAALAATPAPAVAEAARATLREVLAACPGCADETSRPP